MATRNGIRHKLEQEYLAESLRGRIQYFATTYRESHDQEGVRPSGLTKKRFCKEISLIII